MIDETCPILSQARFQPIPDWDWSFRKIRGIEIRYGLPRSRKKYDAVALILGGLGDFGEQYFEFSQDLDRRNIKPIIIDLPGQGGSSRYLKNPNKRHSAGFDELLKDLHIIIDEVVLSAAIDMDNNHKRLPIILFGHSMGGHLALRYLAEYNKSSKGAKIFTAATVTAPMVKIKLVENPLSSFLVHGLVKLLSLHPTAYVPGGQNWSENYRDRKGIKGIFSQDPERSSLQKAFFSHPEYRHLSIGSPTTKWLADALKSCKKLNKRNYLETIDVPVLISIAQKDQLVSNIAIHEAASKIPFAEIQEIKEAQHEILMELDEYRTEFIDRFFTFIENNVFNKADKGKTYIQ